MKETHYYDIYRDGEHLTARKDLEDAIYWARILAKRWKNITVVHRTVIEDEPIIISEER